MGPARLRRRRALAASVSRGGQAARRLASATATARTSASSAATNARTTALGGDGRRPLPRQHGGHRIGEGGHVGGIA